MITDVVLHLILETLDVSKQVLFLKQRTFLDVTSENRPLFVFLLSHACGGGDGIIALRFAVD